MRNLREKLEMYQSRLEHWYDLADHERVFVRAYSLEVESLRRRLREVITFMDESVARHADCENKARLCQIQIDKLKEIEGVDDGQEEREGTQAPAPAQRPGAEVQKAETAVGQDQTP